MKDVDMLDFNEYDSRLFAIINDAILHSMDTTHFKNITPEEEYNELSSLAEQAIKQGYSL